MLALKPIQCSARFRRCQVHDLPAAGIGQVVEVTGHGRGAGGQPLWAYEVHGVGGGVVGVRGLVRIAVVGGDPGTGKPYFGSPMRVSEVDIKGSR